MASATADIDSLASRANTGTLKQPFRRRFEHARKHGEPVASELAAFDRIGLWSLADHTESPLRLVALRLLLIVLHIGECDLGPAFLLLLEKERATGQQNWSAIEIMRHAGAVCFDEALEL